LAAAAALPHWLQIKAALAVARVAFMEAETTEAPQAQRKAALEAKATGQQAAQAASVV
jgi:hypothetical protein